MAWAPFSVNSNGQVRNLQMGLEDQRLYQRMYALDLIESGFINQRRGSAASDHQKILKKTLNLMTSSQMDAFKVAGEPEDVKERAMETPTSAAAVSWHVVWLNKEFHLSKSVWAAGIITKISTRHFATPNFWNWTSHECLGRGLEQRELLQDTAIIWMGEFSRTPRINGNAGRDHWARSWSVVVGGGGLNGGLAIGETNSDGTR